MPTNYPLWPDVPAVEDLLGFHEIAVPVVDTIGLERLDPVSIGVFGPWGSGKSTDCCQTRELLSNLRASRRANWWSFRTSSPTPIDVRPLARDLHLDDHVSGGSPEAASKRVSERRLVGEHTEKAHHRCRGGCCWRPQPANRRRFGRKR